MGIFQEGELHYFQIITKHLLTATELMVLLWQSVNDCQQTELISVQIVILNQTSQLSDTGAVWTIPPLASYGAASASIILSGVCWEPGLRFKSHTPPNTNFRMVNSQLVTQKTTNSPMPHYSFKDLGYFYVAK